MDNDFMQQMEIRWDDLNTRMLAAEKALTQIPQINLQSDPSRPPGVVVEPSALVVE